mgnify:CR=1 FL=1
MTRPIIIGVHGLAGSGKDTIAEHLVVQHDFEAIAFADPLKAMLCALGLNESHFSRQAKETMVPWLGRTPRDLMDSLGDWVRTACGDDALVRIARRQYQLLYWGHGRKRYVFPDVRRDDEAAFVKQLGGVVWNVVSPRDYKPSDHEIHRSIDPALVDDICINSGTLEELYSWIDRRIDQFREAA